VPYSLSPFFVADSGCSTPLPDKTRITQLLRAIYWKQPLLLLRATKWIPIINILILVAGSGSSTSIGQNTNYNITKGDLLETAATPATRYQTDTKNQAGSSPLLVKLRALYEQGEHHCTKTGSLFPSFTCSFFCEYTIYKSRVC
jgi:hypothetical protein